VPESGPWISPNRMKQTRIGIQTNGG